MARKTLNDEFRDQYAFEHQRRVELNAITLPATLIGTLGGALSIGAAGLSQPFDVWRWVQIGLGGIALLLLIIAATHLILSYVRRGYGWVSNPSELRNDVAVLKEYYQGTRSEEEIEDEVLDHLSGKYGDHADLNARTNDNRLTHLHNAKLYIVFAIPFVVGYYLIHVITGVR